mmetsp:Transcript_38792/g.97057  ORF Transcript_38792/g.97057 Transcript_38792/m.97057 type:complete len:469 (+) Transcript_38792:566-1972(+)
MQSEGGLARPSHAAKRKTDQSASLCLGHMLFCNERVLEKHRHGRVCVHAANGLGEQFADRQHPQLLGKNVVRQWDGVGDDELIDGGLVDAVYRALGKHTVGRVHENTTGTGFLEEIGCLEGPTSRVDDVVHNDAVAPLDVTHKPIMPTQTRNILFLPSLGDDGVVGEGPRRRQDERRALPAAPLRPVGHHGRQTRVDAHPRQPVPEGFCPLAAHIVGRYHNHLLQMFLLEVLDGQRLCVDVMHGDLSGEETLHSGVVNVHQDDAVHAQRRQHECHISGSYRPWAMGLKHLRLTRIAEVWDDSGDAFGRRPSQCRRHEQQFHEGRVSVLLAVGGTLEDVHVTPTHLVEHLHRDFSVSELAAEGTTQRDAQVCAYFPGQLRAAAAGEDLHLAELGHLVVIVATHLFASHGGRLLVRQLGGIPLLTMRHPPPLDAPTSQPRPTNAHRSKQGKRQPLRPPCSWCLLSATMTH